MKKLIAVVIAIVSMLFAYANAEMVAIGSCTASSRVGWEIDAVNIDAVSMWVDPDEEWYSHISGCNTYVEVYGYSSVTIAYAVTLENGEILTDDELFGYIEWLIFDECGSFDEVVVADANDLGIIEGIFVGEDQVAEAICLTEEIHNEKQAER